MARLAGMRSRPGSLLALIVLGTVATLYLYSNRILAGIVPHLLARALPGRIRTTGIEASLLHGVTIRGLVIQEEEAETTGSPVPPVVDGDRGTVFASGPPGAGSRGAIARIDEVRLVFNVFKSLLRLDRFVTVRIHRPRLSVDLEHPLFDPFQLRAFNRFLHDEGVSLDFAVRDGDLKVSGLPYRPEGFHASFDADLSLGSENPAPYRIAMRDERTAYNLEGHLDLDSLSTEAAVEFASNQLLAEPLRHGAWTYQTPLEGLARVRVGLHRAEPPAKSGSRNHELGPGRWLSLEYQGRVHARAGVLVGPGPGDRFVGLESRAAFTPDGLVIEDGHVPLERGGVRVGGAVPGFEPGRAHLALTLDRIPLADLGDRRPIQVEGLLDGRIEWQAGATPRFQLEIEKPTGIIFRFDRVVISGTWDAGLVEVESFRARAGSGEATARGRFDQASNRYRFQANFDRFPHWTFEDFLARRGITAGTFSGTLQGEGTLRPPSYEGWTYEFDIVEPVLATMPFDRARLAGRHDRGSSWVDALEGSRAGWVDQVRISITETPESGWSAEGSFAGVDIARCSEGSRGRAGGTFRLRRGAHGLVVENLEARLSDLTVAGETATTRDPLHITLTPRGRGGHSVRLSLPGAGEIEVTLPAMRTRPGVPDGGVPSELRPLLDPARWSRLAASGRFRFEDVPAFFRALGRDPPGGVAEGKMEGTFRVPRGLARAREELEVELARFNLRCPQGHLRGRRARLTTRDGVLRIESRELKLGSAPATLAGTLSPGGVLDARVEVRDLPFGGADSVLSDLGVQGRVGATVQLAGTVDAPRATGRFQVTGLRLPDEPDLFPPGRTRLSGEFALADGTLEVPRCRLESGPIDLAASGRLPVRWRVGEDPGWGEGPLAVGIRLPRTDARLLKVFFPGAIRSVTGHVRADVTIAGTPAAPEARGALELDAERLVTPHLPTPITNLKVSLQATDRGTELRSLSARLLGGRLTGEGQLPLTVPEGGPGSLAMKFDLTGLNHEGEGVRIENLGGSFALRGTVAQPRLVGKLGFDKAEATPGAGTADWSRIERLRKTFAASPLADLDVDLDLDVPGNFWIKSSPLNAEMKGHVTVKGPLARFRLAGELEAERGSMYVQGRRLRLAKGSIKFDRPSRENYFELTMLDSPNLEVPRDVPYLHFGGESEIDTVRVFVDVKGYAVADGVATQLRSLPPMEDGEVMALLATGQRSTTSLSGREVPDLLGFSLANQMQSSIVDRQVEGLVQKFFELDNFRLNSNFVRIGPGPTTSSSVSMGKYLAPNVYVAADGRIGGRDPFFQRLELQLKLQRNTALTLERNMGGEAIGGGGPFDRPYSQDPENRIGVVQQMRW